MAGRQPEIAFCGQFGSRLRLGHPPQHPCIMEKKPLVLVTGASSFVGSHCVNLLLQEGYKVRGTVRGLTKPKALAVKDTFRQFGDSLELVDADLTQRKGWEEACKGCTYVMHIASPCEVSNYTEDALNQKLRPDPEVQKAIDTTVNGALFVVEAAMKSGVQRLVLTSSGAACLVPGIVDPFFPDLHKPSRAIVDKGYAMTMNEDVWTDESQDVGYVVAKTRAERLCWEAVKGSSMEMVSIIPERIYGPALHKMLKADSLVLVDIILKQPKGEPAKVTSLPDLWETYVDVRDVARGHLKALLLPELAGQRCYCSAGEWNSYEMMDLAIEQFKPMGYDLMTKRAPKWLVRAMGLCSPLHYKMFLVWGRKPKKNFRQKLGIEYIDKKIMFEDTVLAQVAVGRYERTPGYKTDKPEFQQLTGDFISLKATL